MKSTDFNGTYTYPDKFLPLSGGNISQGSNLSGNLGVGFTNPDQKLLVDAGIKVKDTGLNPGSTVDNTLYIQRIRNAASYRPCVNHKAYTGINHRWLKTVMEYPTHV